MTNNLFSAVYPHSKMVGDTSQSFVKPTKIIAEATNQGQLGILHSAIPEVWL